MEYRRFYIQGGTYFFTVVTYNRKPIFSSDEVISLLRCSFHYTMQKHPFTIIANVILPDHMHFIWTLPENDDNYSLRWQMIKNHFTRHYINKEIKSSSSSKQLKGEKDIWQRRFWEHYIYNQEDFENHFNYIHYNPVKHEYVESASEWEYSSIHKYIKEGYEEPTETGMDLEWDK